MQYAKDAAGQRIEPTPGDMARCPVCDHPVRARCGQVNVWHWAHLQGGDCDTWAEPETRWHRAYKLIVPADRREVRHGQHRADMVNRHGAVLELQHSAIATEDIEAREDHYGPSMRWLFDARLAFWKGRISLRHKQGESGSRYVTFRWKHARRSITACSRPVFLDLGQGLLLQVKKTYPGPPYNGWGYLLRTADIWNWLLTGTPPSTRLTARPNGETMKNWISHYATTLADTCGLTDSDVSSVLQESLFPPDGTITADMLYALLHLRAEGGIPVGLDTLVSDVRLVETNRLNDGSFTYRCPTCTGSQHRRYPEAKAALLTVDCDCGAGALVRVGDPPEGESAGAGETWRIRVDPT